MYKMLTAIAMTMVIFGLIVSIGILPSSAQNNATAPSSDNQTAKGDYNMTSLLEEDDQSGEISKARQNR